MAKLQDSADPPNSAEVLRIWASLSRPNQFGWEPVAEMIQVAEAEALKLESRLKQLLHTSDEALKAISLCDPLMADAGLNRWLKKEREEAYSDWLAWILEQLSAIDVLHILGITDPEIVKGLRSHSFKIERESFIPYGRLDLLLTFPNFLIVVIEVKKYSAETSNTAKQAGYHKWLDSQPFLHRRGLLLTTDASEEKYEKFSTVLWGDICIRFRRLLPKLLTSIDLVKTAMIVAFISAVETNLLNLVVPPAEAVERLFYARTIEHLQKFMGGDAV